MLFATITNANFSPSDFEGWIVEGLAHRDSLRAAFVAAGGKVTGGLPGAATWSAANVEAIRAAAAAGIGGWKEIADENVRALQSLVLYGLKGMAAYVEHAWAIGKKSKEVFQFMLRALADLTDSSKSLDELTALVLETGKFGVDAMALLEIGRAHV